MKKMPSLRVQEIMTRCVATVAPTATLADAAREMWDKNCGFIPVVDPDSLALIGVLTDRDVCMGALTQGRPIHEIPVTRSMSHDVATCEAAAEVAKVQETMRSRRIRRLVVVDERKRIAGVLSLDDLARAAMDPGSRKSEPHLRREVAKTLGVVARPEPVIELQKACEG